MKINWKRLLNYLVFGIAAYGGYEEGKKAAEEKKPFLTKKELIFVGIIVLALVIFLIWVSVTTSRY